MIRYCVDAKGFEGILEEGRAYRVRIANDLTRAVFIGPFCFCASRFSKEDPAK